MELIKKHIAEYKRAISIKLSKGKPPIIIAGLGRCGTTLVFNSIITNHFYLGHNGVIQIQNYSGVFSKDYVYKTHDYPAVSTLENAKIVFMFGNPYNTILSTHYHINMFGVLHHRHLGSKMYKTNDDIFYNDTLDLGRLFDSWYKPQNFDFLSVRYESLYDKNTIENLSDYLGFNLKLFPYKPRSTDWNIHPMKEELIKTYGDLYDKIEKAEDVKLWKKN